MPLKNNVKKKTQRFKRGRTSLLKTLETVLEGRINIRLRVREKRERK